MHPPKPSSRHRGSARLPAGHSGACSAGGPFGSGCGWSSRPTRSSSCASLSTLPPHRLKASERSLNRRRASTRTNHRWRSHESDLRRFSAPPDAEVAFARDRDAPGRDERLDAVREILTEGLTRLRGHRPKLAFVVAPREHVREVFFNAREDGPVGFCEALHLAKSQFPKLLNPSFGLPHSDDAGILVDDAAGSQQARDLRYGRSCRAVFHQRVEERFRDWVSRSGPLAEDESAPRPEDSVCLGETLHPSNRRDAET